MTCAPRYICFDEMDKHYGQQLVWQPKSAEQTNFVHARSKHSMIEYLRDNCKTKVSRYYNEINRFLQENDFDIQLAPFDPVDCCGFAAILKLLVKWKTTGTEGHRVTPKNGEQSYKAFMLKDFKYWLDDGRNVLLEIETKDPNVRMFIRRDDQSEFAGVSSYEALNAIETLKRRFGLQNSSARCHSDKEDDMLIIPVIEYDQEEDISHLLGLRAPCKGNVLRIVDAKQQTKFQMNHLGAKVESAAAVVCRQECYIPPFIYTVDKPFFVWLEHKGYNLPLFVGYMTNDSWKPEN